MNLHDSSVEYVEKRSRQKQIAEEDSRAWRQQKEHCRLQKIQEQKQARDMMERYWPWGRHWEVKPRGLRNLRLEGLFPHRDYEQAKRSVGGLDLGRPGGGAPNVNDTGRRIVRTREDPLLRFQWGKDLRRCVDNTLRYKMDKKQQEEYKRELDKLVEEKIKQRETEKLESLQKDREIGYTNGKRNEKENRKAKIMEDFKRTTLRPPNQIVRNGRAYPRKYLYDYNFTTKGPNQAILRRTQLSPLRDGKENGVELVPLIVEKRPNLKIPLSTTDVTRQGFCTKTPKWVMEGPEYLQELDKQMKYKKQHLEDLRMKDVEGATKHFNTWDAFWGRPGHGAPRSALKKGCIQKMLYPKLIPIAAT